MTSKTLFRRLQRKEPVGESVGRPSWVSDPHLYTETPHMARCGSELDFAAFGVADVALSLETEQDNTVRKPSGP